MGTDVHYAFWRSRARALMRTCRRQAERIEELEHEVRRLNDDWEDLAQRLRDAQSKISALAGTSMESDTRLRGKRSGVSLALDYLRGYRRAA